VASRMAQKNDYLFGLYYQLGPERSLEKLTDVLAGVGLRTSLNTVKRYSADFGWQNRVIELDTKAQEQREQEHIQVIEAMNQRQSNIGVAMQGLGANGLRNLQPNLLSASEIVSLTREGARMERLAQGEATSRSEIATQVVNRVVIAIVDLFNQVNSIANGDERRRQFALGADQIISDKTVEAMQDVKRNEVVVDG